MESLELGIPRESENQLLYLVFVFFTAVSSCGGRAAEEVAETLHEDLTAVAGTKSRRFVQLDADPVMKHTLTRNLAGGPISIFAVRLSTQLWELKCN
jgi:hypothetical protein